MPGRFSRAAFESDMTPLLHCRKEVANEEWNMPDKTWERVERDIAALLGGRRVGCTGQATPDVEAPGLVAEVKHRRTLPAGLADALGRAQAHVQDGQVGVAVLHRHRIGDSLVVIRLEDFATLRGRNQGGTDDVD
jgi:hypothetical protein